MNQRSASTWSVISEFSQIILGVLLASIGLKAFLLPNGFLDGGATGIAILLNARTGFHISIFILLVSVPFMILAAFTLSKRILWKSILSIALLCLFLEIESFPIITDDKLLIAIFGGLFLGAGIGIAIRNGAVLDGTEVLGIFLYDRFGIRIGLVVLIFNVILFIITAFLLSVEVAMYSILTYLVTAKVIDQFIEGFEDFIGIMIISKNSEEIESALYNRTGVGLTVYKGLSGYGKKGHNKDFRIIHTMINRIDMRKMQRIVQQIDPEAFLMEFDINDIRGGIQRRYLAKDKKA
jgi:uncharacterized membrane-anchored protein YitT (DUF2179 family)